jgi:hypothetical protein
MKPEDMQRFESVLRGLCEVYDKELTPFFSSAYFAALEDLDIDEIGKAAIGYMRMPEKDCRFMPKPGDLRAMVEGRNDDAATLAWAKICKAMRQQGSYQSVAFDDPIIHRVLTDMGGWAWFGASLEKELPFIERRFCDAYKTYRRTEKSFDYPPYLPGITESENSLRDYPFPSPILIGDQDRAREVMATAGLDGEADMTPTTELLGRVKEAVTAPTRDAA